MLFGVNESNKQIKEERIQSELETVKNILRKMDGHAPNNDMSIYRLGKYEPEKVRPIKVSFETRELALNILRQKNKLDSTQGVYIKSDQTQMQRRFLGSVIAELKQKTEKSETNLKIKYINSVPKIIKVKEQASSKN